MDRKIFYDKIRASLFNGSLSKQQVEGIDRLLNTSADIKLTDEGQLAYILATSYHETGQRMYPVRETYATSDSSAISKLENAWKKGQLPWVKTPYWRKDADGKSWYGRGDVQLTWKDNYVKMNPYVKKKFGIDIVEDPNNVLNPNISAFILFEGMLKGQTNKGDFTSYSLENFVTGTKQDFVGARKVVNGTDRASTIAGYAKKFLEAIKAAGGVPVTITKPAETVKEIPIDVYVPEPEEEKIVINPPSEDSIVVTVPEKKTLLDYIIELLIKIFKGK